MSTKLKAKDIANMVMPALTPRLESEGFQSYKEKQFIKISEGIVFYISFQLNKNNMYIWSAAYPLCQHRLWFGSGFLVKKFPENEGGLKVDTEEDIKFVLGKLANGLDNIFEFFKERQSVDAVEEKISKDGKLGHLLIKGICLAAMNKPDDAKIFLEKFILSGVGLIDDKDGVENLLAAISDGSHLELLEANKAANIKKLRLKKFLPK